MTDEKPRAFVKLRVQGLTLGVDVAHLAEVSYLTSLMPMLSDEHSVLGCINLRGVLIPVLDAALLCGLTKQPTPPPFAAIITFNDRTLAIGVDEIAGLSKAQHHQLQSFAHAVTENDSMQTHAFLDLDHKVIILDVPAIFHRPGIPTTNFRRFTLLNTANSSRTTDRHLIFGAGGAVFSLAASDIHGTVPRTSIEQNALSSGYSLGSIDYRGRRVAVTCTVKLIGIGSPRDTAPSEVIILNIDGDQLLGLAVDSITNLQSIEAADFAALPEVMSEHFRFVDKIMVTSSGQLVYNINATRLRLDGQIQALSGISAAQSVTDKQFGAPINDAVTAIPENRKFLTYECGGEIATPLDQITGILDEPKNIMPLVGPSSALVGVFSHAGRPIPLINLRSSYETVSRTVGGVKILLVGQGATQVGFAVDRINSLASSLRSFESSVGGICETTVQLLISGKPKMFHVIDLKEMADAITKNDAREVCKVVVNE